MTVGVINGGNKALGVVVVIILRQHRVPGGHACYAVVGVGRDGIAARLYLREPSVRAVIIADSRSGIGIAVG